MIVQLENVVVAANRYPLLSGATWHIEEPGLYLVSGANGAGKTSLLRTVAGLDVPTSGRGRVLEIDLLGPHRRRLRQRVGWLGHHGSFYDDLTVVENLTFALQATGLGVTDLGPTLERVGLAAKGNVLARRLSAGQRRRLALAWLLLRRPELWVLDEPYASLDVEGRTFVDQLMTDVVAAGATVIFSAHLETATTLTLSGHVDVAGGTVVAA